MPKHDKAWRHKLRESIKMVTDPEVIDPQSIVIVFNDDQLMAIRNIREAITGLDRRNQSHHGWTGADERNVWIGKLQEMLEPMIEEAIDVIIEIDECRCNECKAANAALN